MPALVSIVTAVWNVLGPIATEMVRHALAGKDPLDVLVKERVREIVPDVLLSELELARIEAEEAARVPPTPHS